MESTVDQQGRRAAKAPLKERVLAVVYPAETTRAFWIALISVALLLRVVVTMGVLGNMPLFSDANAHAGQAADLVNGVNQDLPYYFPVGTSYVLAAGYWLFGVHLWVAHVAMIIVSVFSVITTVLLARRLVRDVRVAILAGWALALYPGMWLMAAQPFSFDVTLLCINLIMLFGLRAWENGRLLDYAIAGIALGFAAVTRPSTVSIALPLLVGAVIIMRRRRSEGAPTGAPRFAVGCAVLALFAAGTMAPAVAHNASNDQGLTLSVNNDLNTWLGNNPYTPNYRTNYLGQHPIDEFPPEVTRYMRPFVYGNDPTRAQRAADRDEVVRFVEHHPAVTALRTVNRVRGFWGFDYTVSNLFRTDWGKGAKAEAVGLVFEAGGYFVLALLAIIGLIFARDRLRPGALSLLLWVIALFMLPYIFVYSGGRWHYPILSLLAIFAAIGTAWMLETPGWWQKLRTSRAFWISVAIFAAIQIEYAYYLFVWDYSV